MHDSFSSHKDMVIDIMVLHPVKEDLRTRPLKQLLGLSYIKLVSATRYYSRRMWDKASDCW
jgi:hypothetical protein